jgi:hypothetical protein
MVIDDDDDDDDDDALLFGPTQASALMLAQGAPADVVAPVAAPALMRSGSSSSSSSNSGDDVENADEVPAQVHARIPTSSSSSDDDAEAFAQVPAARQDTGAERKTKRRIRSRHAAVARAGTATAATTATAAAAAAADRDTDLDFDGSDDADDRDGIDIDMLSSQFDATATHAKMMAKIGLGQVDDLGEDEDALQHRIRNVDDAAGLQIKREALFDVGAGADADADTAELFTFNAATVGNLGDSTAERAEKRKRDDASAEEARLDAECEEQDTGNFAGTHTIQSDDDEHADLDSDGFKCDSEAEAESGGTTESDDEDNVKLKDLKNKRIRVKYDECATSWDLVAFYDDAHRPMERPHAEANHGGGEPAEVNGRSRRTHRKARCVDVEDWDRRHQGYQKTARLSWGRILTRVPLEGKVSKNNTGALPRGAAIVAPLTRPVLDDASKMVEIGVAMGIAAPRHAVLPMHILVGVDTPRTTMLKDSSDPTKRVKAYVIELNDRVVAGHQYRMVEQEKKQVRTSNQYQLR